MFSQKEGQRIYVLVEEEEKIRQNWLVIAKEKNLILYTYPTENWFLDDFENGFFSGVERFYLDQDFGAERGVGLRLSRKIRQRWPQAYVSLVTGYPKDFFQRELESGVLADVHGKYPEPFESRRETTFEQAYDLLVWRPLVENMRQNRVSLSGSDLLQ